MGKVPQRRYVGLSIPATYPVVKQSKLVLYLSLEGNVCTYTLVSNYYRPTFETSLNRNTKNGNGTILLHSPVTVTLKVMVSIPAGLTAVTEYRPLSLGS